MDFNTYANIYEELINTTTNKLNSKYFIDKYSLTHVELKTILVKIKENEYISKENKVLKDILFELEEYKADFSIFSKIKSKKSDDIYIETNKKIVDETKKKDNFIVILSNIKEDFKSKLKNINIKKDQYMKFGIGAFGILLIFSITTFILSSSNSNTEKKEHISALDTKEINTNIKKVVTLQDKDVNVENSNEDLLSKKEETDTTKTLDTIKKEKVVNVEEKLDSIKVIKNEKENRVRAIITIDERKEQIKPKTNVSKNSSNNKLAIKKEFNNIKDDLTYENHMIKYKNKYYKENDILEGYKIFKITPVYVKFEDTKTNIRKRVLLN
ncbi:hypothetical protein CRU98_00020 [Arcobacter sp. CECT 8986]|uniref:hypothetical protein n=1 Tax=Arcobacter sp. CECT 8986 TaxID=2044507 RepID=UPI001009B036|nr:hypothetical protein [Arcobacter sp. CECT 8986]RXK00869.1 hypothetical protein CRU98_00020 [Arcobacter sp. CECT 8986]